MKELTRLVEILENKCIDIERKHFVIWKDSFLQWKQSEQTKQKNHLIERVIEVLKTSKKGKRSLVEQEILSKYLISIPCVPKLTSGDMKRLSNEVDWIDCSGRSLIFLQGDYGACFYMIAQGSVDLFLETSKDKEMSNCRKFGDYRGKSILPEECNELGKKITTLTEGKGFGEYAILSKTHKFRGASAVASDDRSLLLVVLEDTYNHVFRKHHFRQAQMSSAMTLLKDIPAFNWYSYSKMSQIAYNLKSQSYSTRGLVVVRAGQQLSHVLLIHSGLIRAVTSSLPSATSPTSTISTATIPSLPLSVRELGRGQVIGESEVLRGLTVFEMTYEACGPCEVFELTRAHFEEVISASRLSLHEVVNEDSHQKESPSPRLHDLNQLSRQFHSISARNHQPQPNPPIPFRTYMHHEHSQVIPINKGTEKKGPQMISTYEEIKEGTLLREMTHLNKIERVRRALMDMSLETPSSSPNSPSSLVPLSLPSNSLTEENYGFTKTTKSPRKKKGETKSGKDKEGGSLWEEIEMVEDLRAVLPLFSGSLIERENSHSSHSNTTRSPRPPPTPSPSLSSSLYSVPSRTMALHVTLSPCSPSTLSHPVTPNFSPKVFEKVAKELFLEEKKEEEYVNGNRPKELMGSGRPLLLASPQHYISPSSNTIIQQYHRSIGRSDIVNAHSLFRSTNPPPSLSLPAPLTLSPTTPQNTSEPLSIPHKSYSLSHPPHSPSHPIKEDNSNSNVTLSLASPSLSPRPPRMSHEGHISLDTNTEEELIYEKERNKHRTGALLRENPFEALGLPVTNVYRSPEKDSKLTPQPPSLQTQPKATGFAYGRRPVQIVTQTSLAAARE